MRTRDHMAGIGVSLELETSPRERHHEGKHPRQTYARRPEETYGSGVYASGQMLIVPRPFGPPVGYFWHVMAVQITGVTSANIAGQADLFVGPEPSQNAGDAGPSWRDTTRYNTSLATQLPLSAFYAEWQFIVRGGYGLYAIIASGTATAGYSLRADVIMQVDPSGPVARPEMP